ncbi:MAG: nucleoside triphosphate pyrophosphohydrolase [Desulfobacterales bacterium]|nr:MAG: nucleoside triphosphate pyrophosphohydrolase [Desulfobacterales bacterium]
MGIEAITELIDALRGKNGCPWDRKQTPQTISVYLVEEIYELIDAIESEEHERVCEELGDVLFQLLFLINLFRDMGHFGLERVIDLIVEKMKRRHPHVFGKDEVNSAEIVQQQWHKIKIKEKQHLPVESVLESVPSNLPALMRAYRVSERAAKTGFDWNDVSGVLEKVEEELNELKAALNAHDPTPNDKALLALEFGDILFSLVNVARFVNIHPETALRGSTVKFEKRFKYLEKLVSNSGKDIESIPQHKLDDLWEEAKEKIG